MRLTLLERNENLMKLPSIITMWNVVNQIVKLQPISFSDNIHISSNESINLNVKIEESATPEGVVYDRDGVFFELLTVVFSVVESIIATHSASTTVSIKITDIQTSDVTYMNVIITGKSV